MGQGHDSIEVANIFVDKSQTEPSILGPMTIMSLLKYVYFAHGWTLGRTGKPLICHKVEAWKFGPVVPQIYHKFGRQGIYIREKEHTSLIPPRKATASLSPEEESIVNKVYAEYSKVSALRLSAITHKPGSPWHQYRRVHYGTIPNEVIRRFYENLSEKQS